MASENENMNIAEILTGFPTRENYKDILVSEGQLCGDCNFEAWYEYSISEGGEHCMQLPRTSPYPSVLGCS